MRKKLYIKITVDFLMSALFVFLMGYYISGNAVHEWAGIAAFALFILHNILNYKNFTAMFKGKESAVKTARLTVIVLLWIFMILEIISSIIISQDVFAFLELTARGWKKIHILSSVWLFALAAIHFGFHWSTFMGLGRKLIKPKAENAKTRIIIIRSLAFIIAVCGIIAFCDQALGNGLFLLQSHEQIMQTDMPPVIFYLEYIAIWALFAEAGYYFRYLQTKSKAKQNS